MVSVGGMKEGVVLEGRELSQEGQELGSKWFTGMAWRQQGRGTPAADSCSEQQVQFINHLWRSWVFLSPVLQAAEAERAGSVYIENPISHFWNSHCLS